MVEEIGAAGGKAIANGADVSDHGAAEALVAAAIEQFGRLDVLVNVAGILRDRMVFNMTETEWDDVIRVHLRGTFNTTKFAAAHWRSVRDETAQNRLINFTSVSGTARRARTAELCRREDGHRRAHVLLRARADQVRGDGQRGLARRRDPDDRIGAAGPPPSVTAIRRERSPDNVAPVVAYLASERSGWINGRIVHASGYEVSLYSNPEPVVRIIGTEPWDLDALAEQVERSFGPLLGRRP